MCLPLGLLNLVFGCGEDPFWGKAKHYQEIVDRRRRAETVHAYPGVGRAHVAIRTDH